MAKQNPPLSILPTITNATTVGPGFVTKTITADIMLAQKTRCVVLTDESGATTASIFRESSYVPGSLSRDIHTWTGTAWQYAQKDPKKYLSAPDPPPGAICTVIDGVACFSVHPLTNEEIMRLRLLIRCTPLGPGIGHSVIAHSVIR